MTRNDNNTKGNTKGNAMKASDKLRILNTEYQKALHEIRQLSLGQWIDLAATLGVEKNNREHAAKIIAIRRLAA